MALAGTGRQAEALTLYEELRHRLDEELGVLPGPTLREAHAKVLRQEIKIQATVSNSTGPADTWQPVFQLPAAPADFTGRAKESKRLISAVSPPGDHPGVPVVVISGLPGAGKTALALFAAHTIRERFPDGQLWVQLAGASSRPRDPGDVLGELLRALGVPGSAIPDDYHERAVCYRSRLADRRVLVVADDAVATAQVRPLVPGTPGCALLVTSRHQLEGLEGAHFMPLDVMTARDAAGFVTRLVGERRVAADPEAIDRLVAVCGSLPLALRIAGAKLATRPSWPVSAMVRRLTGEHGRLRELETEELSVRASIASSYQSLSARSCRAFRLLALLGPADFPEWVIGLLLGEPEVADVLDELTSRSLLAPLAIDDSEELRYRLHDLLRDYASERLTEEPPAVGDDALGRLFQGWLQLAQTASEQLSPEPYFPEPASRLATEVIPAAEAKRISADPIAWFTTERLNLLAMTEQACRTGRLDVARSLALAQCRFNHLEDRHDDAERIWSSIAETARHSALTELASYAELRIGAALVERGRAADAMQVLNQSVAAAEGTGHLALALYWRGASAADLEDFERALQDSVRGAHVAHREGIRLAVLMNLRLQSTALALGGSPHRGVDIGEHALAISTRLGVVAYELATLHNLAFACTLAGQHRRALDLCARQLVLNRDIGDKRREAQARGVLGDAYRGLGQPEKAVDSWLSALPLFRSQHAYRHLALCLQRLAGAYEEMTRYPEALASLEESLLIFQRLRLPRKVDQVQDALARCRMAVEGRPSLC